MSDPGQTFRDVLKGELGACSEIGSIVTRPTLQLAWESGPDGGNVWLWHWFMNEFVGDEALLGRVRRSIAAMDHVCLDLARLEYVLTGEPVAVNEKLAYLLRGRLMAALFPTPFEVFDKATTVQAKAAAASIARLIGAKGDPRWMTRSS